MATQRGLGPGHASEFQLKSHKHKKFHHAINIFFLTSPYCNTTNQTNVTLSCCSASNATPRHFWGPWIQKICQEKLFHHSVIIISERSTNFFFFCFVPQTFVTHFRGLCASINLWKKLNYHVTYAIGFVAACCQSGRTLRGYIFPFCFVSLCLLGFLTWQHRAHKKQSQNLALVSSVRPNRVHPFLENPISR